MVSLCALTALATAQDNPRDEFYIKEQVKGFFSLKVDFQRFSDNAIGDINDAAFREDWGYNVVRYDSTNTPIDTGFFPDQERLFHYNQFGPNVLGMNVEIGAQYHQMVTWVDGFFMPTQVSPVPDTVNPEVPSHLQSIKWFRYGFDWMFGYMLLPEKSFVNVIPSAGAGFSLLNMQFASEYDLSWTTPGDAVMASYPLGRRYYSTFGKNVTTQLEVRFNLGNGISVGAYGGARFTWYDRFSVETSTSQTYILNHSELSGNAIFFGGKLTYTLPSVFETKEQNKL